MRDVEKSITVRCPCCAKIWSIDISGEKEQLTALRCEKCAALFMVQVNVQIKTTVWAVKPAAPQST